MGRISRSFQLVGQSYQVLMKDKELLLLPLCSGVAIAAVIFGFFTGFGLHIQDLRSHDPAAYLPLFLMYVATNTIAIFFQAAVIAGATERMNGGNPTLASALAAAGRRIGAILAWAIVAATVGVVLRSVQQRVGFVGRIVVNVLGATWALATFFVVPVLVLEDHSVRSSIRESTDLIKRTWGETLTGSVSLGLASMAAWIALVASVGVLAVLTGKIAAIAIGAVGAVLLLTTFSALQGVFVASLYRFASHGHAPDGFDQSLLTQAFAPKR